ncbi:MAG: hypothetical protein D6832_06075 [Alphaproteobacteria bacterium]|nr:MAG: hypothetical protein D6832_06075 [Alphaproteobacteria bacterium]
MYKLYERFVESKNDMGGWISDNMLIQPIKWQLSEALELADSEDNAGGDSVAAQSIRIAHVVNFYETEDREARKVQQTTARSMIAAKDHGRASVRLFSVQTAEEKDVTPAGFERLPPLERDIRSFCDTKRPLPIISDIIDRASQAVDDDSYLIFTDAGICVRPHFYDFIVKIVTRYGFDAIVVNRKNVHYRLIDALGEPELDAEPGTIHPGHDCFVIKNEIYKKFIPTLTCIGAGAASTSLFYNIAAFARKAFLITNAHLTYHFGDEKGWRKGRENRMLADHNRRQYEELFKRFMASEHRDRVLAYEKRWHAPPKRFFFINRPRICRTRPQP